MSEPMRWRDAGPSAARELLAAARPPRPMTTGERARSTARVAAIAAAPIALGAAASGWSAKTLAILFGCGAVGVAIGLGALGIHGRPSVVDTERATVVSTPIASGSVTSAQSAPPVASSSALTIATNAAPIASSVRPSPTPPSSASSAPSASASSPIKAGDSLERELAMLQQAQAEISSDPAAALAVLDAHQAQFPAGKLAAERELLAIDALRRLGRNAEAKHRGEVFIAAHPGSLYADRVHKIIDGL